MSMVDITKMYIGMYKAICQYGGKDEDDMEDIHMIQQIVHLINENLKYYNIEYYDEYKHGTTPTEALEDYIDQLSKKYLNVDNIWEHPLWTRSLFPYNATVEKVEERKIMNNIKTEKQVKEFLDWWKEEMDCCLVQYFDYTIINKNDIEKTITSTEYDDLIIQISDYGWLQPEYNPIITWVNSADGRCLYIMDWKSLKTEMVDEGWICDNTTLKDFKEKFGIKPTLEEYVRNQYSNLHPEVQNALIKEVKEFYDAYKDDIYMENDCAFSKSDNMMLVDAIWNHAPLFCNSTINHIIEKIYNKEIKIK